MKKLRRRLLWAVVNVCRFLLALTLLFSGTVKLIDPRGFQYKLEDYAVALGLRDFLPAFTPVCLAVALAMVEFMLGINLFFGIRRKTTAAATLALMLVYTPLTLYVVATGKVVDCGCFGDALTLTGWQTFGKNITLLLAAVVAVWHWRIMTRLISERNQWTIAVYSVVFSLALALHSIYRLPPIDFRPYHVGADLPRGILNDWEGAEARPLDADFSIETPEDGDITLEWLSQPGYKFLLVSPYIETADDGAMDDINSIYEYSKGQGYPFLCLTSSAPEAVERWKDITGAEYPFALSDGTALKTVIRSNPGLLLLRDGVVIGKWPSSALPDGETLTAPLEELSIGLPRGRGYMRGSLRLLLWFFIPFLAFALVDRLWTGGRYIITHRLSITRNTKHKEDEKENRGRQLEDEP